MSEHLDVATFEANHQNLKLIKRIDHGPWKIELFLEELTGHYYAKGPFARWDAICYIFLRNVHSQEDVENWIKMMEKSS